MWNNHTNKCKIDWFINTAWNENEFQPFAESQKILIEFWCGSWPAGSCVVAAIDKYTRTTEILWRKRDSTATLSVRDGMRARVSPREHPTPAWTGFYCFSGHITLRMVLIYYEQVRCRWLPFTDNKGQDAGNYFKEKDVTAQGVKWLNWCFSTGFRKLKMLSKHLLPQSRVREL